MPPPHHHHCRCSLAPFLVILIVHLQPSPFSTASTFLPPFREAPAFRNGRGCPKTTWPNSNPNTLSLIHVAMTLDATYLRGSVAGVFSVLQHATCPQNIVFHFLTADADHHATTTTSLHHVIATTFPYLNFHLYRFDTSLVSHLITSSIRSSLDQPLNYARIYLADLLPSSVHRIIYFDSDLILVDDISNLWRINLNSHILGAPEYCHANFTSYFNPQFWFNQGYAAAFKGRKPCYFNTGVMVIDLKKWRAGKYTQKLEHWMRVQKGSRIYELGSLPPFLLVFAGDVEGVEHRWNQHGLGGDNLEGLCRDLHPGPVSLLHWSGKGKPWLRIDSRRPCPLDSLWAPYDLLKHPSLLSDS